MRKVKDEKKHRCYQCRYLTMVGEFACCDYFSVTGKPRSFPNGKNGTHIPWSNTEPCEHYERRKGSRFPTVPEGPRSKESREDEEAPKIDKRKGLRCTWDYEKAVRLYRLGKTFDEIAKSVGTDEATISRYAQRYGWHQIRINATDGG